MFRNKAKIIGSRATSKMSGFAQSILFEKLNSIRTLIGSQNQLQKRASKCACFKVLVIVPRPGPVLSPTRVYSVKVFIHMDDAKTQEISLNITLQNAHL